MLAEMMAALQFQWAAALLDAYSVDLTWCLARVHRTGSGKYPSIDAQSTYTGGATSLHGIFQLLMPVPGYLGALHKEACTQIKGLATGREEGAFRCKSGNTLGGSTTASRGRVQHSIQ